jgi:hypothetical protein
MCAKLVDWILYIDLENAFNTIKWVSPTLRISRLLDITWVQFHDTEKCFVKEASIWICWIGGIPVSLSNDRVNLWWLSIMPSIYFSEMRKMKAFWGFMSYLNSNDKSTEEMLGTMKSLWHSSTEHMIFINILITWLSTSVENEFNSQRDLIHLARITEARTTIQNSPPLVVLDEALLPFYEKIKKFMNENRPDASFISNLSKKDHLEAINLAHPAAKATAVILSWSLRNFKKIAAMKDDAGKEVEFRRILCKLDSLINQMWI